MSDTCKTCEFWSSEPEDIETNIEGAGLCHYVMHPSDYLKRDKKDGKYRARSMYADRKAFVQDSEDYKAVFLTFSNFGCAAWKKDDDAP
jgi:hypothetical protein